VTRTQPTSTIVLLVTKFRAQTIATAYSEGPERAAGAVRAQQPPTRRSTSNRSAESVLRQHTQRGTVRPVQYCVLGTLCLARCGSSSLHRIVRGRRRVDRDAGARAAGWPGDPARRAGPLQRSTGGKEATEGASGHYAYDGNATQRIHARDPPDQNNVTWHSFDSKRAAQVTALRLGPQAAAAFPQLYVPDLERNIANALEPVYCYTHTLFSDATLIHPS
jgi:hypothetical protein